MKKFIVLGLLGMSAHAAAVDTEVGTSIARDETGYQIHKWSAVYRPAPLGIRLQHNRFTQAGESTGVGTDLQWALGKLYLDGHAALMNYSGSNYVDADVNAVYSLTDTVTVNLGVSADTIAGSRIAPGTVNFHATTLGIEHSTKNWGVLANTRYLWRTDGNNQGGWLVRGWTTVLPGVSLYMTHREYSNNTTTPLYFSPTEYRRTGVGVTVRRQFGPTGVSLNLEPGISRSNGETTNTQLYRFEVNYKLAKNARLIYSLARDLGTNGAYKYTINQLTFRATF